MLYPKFTLLSILCTLVTFSNAQHNVTINSTSPSIQYEGTVGDSPICGANLDGLVLGDQGGCYNAPSHCSAIYITSLLHSLSPIFTVTLDGNSTDVDGVRPSRVLICDILFSQTGLDPNVEHKIRMSAKGPSPNRNTSIPNSEADYIFSLVSYTFTESAGGSNTTTSPPSSAQTARLSGWGSLAAAVAFAWAVAL